MPNAEVVVDELFRHTMRSLCSVFYAFAGVIGLVAHEEKCANGEVVVGGGGKPTVKMSPFPCRCTMMRGLRSSTP